MAQPTLLDIAKLNGNDLDALVEDNLTHAPELSVVPFETITGTDYRTVSRTSFPGTGFRGANEGFTYTNSEFLNRLFQTFIFGGNIRADVAVMTAYEKGPEAFKAIMASGVMKAAMIDLGAQFFYGTAADTKGFPGLATFLAAFNTELTLRGITNLVIDSGGTTAATGSSVYGVKFGEEGVRFLAGKNGAMTLSDWFPQMVNDGTAGQDYLAHVASMNAWIGLQAASPYCIGRLKDNTADANMGVTDIKLASLLALYPVGSKPDRWFMSRRSAGQLQSSRSAVVGTNYSGNASVEMVAAYPTSSNGIPITVTDSLSDVEVLS